MTEIQENLLGLVKEIDDICKKNDITYYISYGSLIGAVRHGGFIPWDDDVDIQMTRDNAEKFKNAVEAEKLENREVFIQSDNYRSMNVQWRYVNTSSTTLIRGLIGSGAVQGQFVDIFILSPMPVEKEKKEKCVEDYRLYKELKAQNTSYETTYSQDYLKRYHRAKRWEKLIGTKRILNYLEKKMFNYPEDEATEYLIRTLMGRLIIPKAWYGNPRYVKFETLEVPIPKYAEKILNYTFGTLWFEMPIYEEHGEHIFISDMEIPYSVYTADYDKHLDVDNFFKEQVKRKEYWFNLLQNRNVINPHIYKLKGMCLSAEIQQTVERYGIDLKKLVENGCERELEIIFKSYFDMMNTSVVKYWETYIDMPDEYLNAAIYFRLFNGNLSLASYVLWLRRTRVTRDLSSDLKRLSALCDATFMLLNTLYGDCDLKKSRSIVDEWIRKEPDALYFMRADIYLKLEEADPDGTDELIALCDKYLQKYEKDGELLKYRGDLLLKKGDTAEAEKCYKKALCNLKNGYCITEIKAYFEAKN